MLFSCLHQKWCGSFAFVDVVVFIIQQARHSFTCTEQVAQNNAVQINLHTCACNMCTPRQSAEVRVWSCEVPAAPYLLHSLSYWWSSSICFAASPHTGHRSCVTLASALRWGQFDGDGRWRIRISYIPAWWSMGTLLVYYQFICSYKYVFFFLIRGNMWLDKYSIMLPLTATIKSMME